ncbi:MAG: glycoside hydrolase family 97 protein [Bacteroidaceae bacterium]|nr:glycoside hydrolase family 97 protein [Bacteroidaceae bacterium]
MKTTKLVVLSAVCCLLFFNLQPITAATKYSLSSPDGKTTVNIMPSPLAFTIEHNGATVLKKSTISLKLTDGTTAKRVSSASRIRRISSKTDAPFYRQRQIATTCNEMTLALTTYISVTFRAYNDGVAYRFNYSGRLPVNVANEQAQFCFFGNPTAWMSYSTNEKKPFAMAFQAPYTKTPLSEASDIPSFLPVTVDCGSAKLTFHESDLEAYPGMFLKKEHTLLLKTGGAKSPTTKSDQVSAELGSALNAVFAHYPKAFDKYPRRQQLYVTDTERYIAKLSGKRSLPWRIIAISDDDTQMPLNNLVYDLASPNRIGDTSWIKPGKVAWDWWNGWNLKGVPFKAGINMDTYKYYIDFASKNNIEYIVLDEGWYEPSSGDMLTVIPELNLPELISYAKEKNVDIVLWTVFNVLDDQLEQACKKYSQMGIKGFKVDFLDRDDQTAQEMAYRIAEKAAKYHLFLDYHGFYAPKGLNRTYPHILNFEGVFGLEDVKWGPEDKDMVTYDVTFPYIRQMCGQSDFTPGAMRNSTHNNWHSNYYNPVSQGTRCHQAAMYVVFDSPFTMLCDAPTNYEPEPEYVSFITDIPTVFDETRIVCGKLGEYIVTARRLGNDWYIGGLNGWNARDVEMNLSFLPEGNYKCILLSDGINADKNAEDYTLDVYKDESNLLNNKRTLSQHMASGGGFVMKLKRQ